MKKIKEILLLNFCFISAFAQNDLQKITTFTQSQLPETKNLIYTGLIYKNNFSASNDNQFPFLAKKNFEKNEIKYNDFVFYDIFLNYDIERDIVLINPDETSQTLYPIELDSEKLDYFFLDNKKFINLTNSKFLSAKNSKVISGFAEEIPISNDVFLFLKIKKSRKELKKDLKIVNEFDVSQEYYLSLDNLLYSIQSERDLNEIYPTKQAQIQSYSDINKFQKSSNFKSYLIGLLQDLQSIKN